MSDDWDIEIDPQPITVPEYITLEDDAEARRCWCWQQVTRTLASNKVDDYIQAATQLEAWLKTGKNQPKLKVVNK